MHTQIARLRAEQDPCRQQGIRQQQELKSSERLQQRSKKRARVMADGRARRDLDVCRGWHRHVQTSQLPTPPLARCASVGVRHRSQEGARQSPPAPAAGSPAPRRAGLAGSPSARSSARSRRLRGRMPGRWSPTSPVAWRGGGEGCLRRAAELVAMTSAASVPRALRRRRPPPPSEVKPGTRWPRALRRRRVRSAAPGRTSTAAPRAERRRVSPSGRPEPAEAVAGQRRLRFAPPLDDLGDDSTGAEHPRHPRPCAECCVISGGGAVRCSHDAATDWLGRAGHCGAVQRPFPCLAYSQHPPGLHNLSRREGRRKQKYPRRCPPPGGGDVRNIGLRCVSWGKYLS